MAQMTAYAPGGPPRHLDRIRRDYPVAFHGRPLASALRRGWLAGFESS